MNLPIIEPPNPHFARIGGAEGAQRLARAFYDALETRADAAVIRGMHPDIASARDKLTLFLVEWLGGPKQYSALHGHPRLRMRHSKFPITWAERDAWMNCMREALARVVDEPSLRDELEFAFARVADAVINRVAEARRG